MEMPKQMGHWDCPSEGGNATLMDANCLKAQQKKKKKMTRRGWMSVYVVEDVSYYFQEHSGKLAVFVQ